MAIRIYLMIQLTLTSDRLNDAANRISWST